MDTFSLTFSLAYCVLVSMATVMCISAAIKSWKMKHREDHYIYGRSSSGLPARRNLRTGMVEFKLWDTEKDNHPQDVWVPLGAGHTMIIGDEHAKS